MLGNVVTYLFLIHSLNSTLLICSRWYVGHEGCCCEFNGFGKNGFLVKTSRGMVRSEVLLLGTSVVGFYVEKLQSEWVGRPKVYFLFGWPTGCVSWLQKLVTPRGVCFERVSAWNLWGNAFKRLISSNQLNW